MEGVQPNAMGAGSEMDESQDMEQAEAAATSAYESGDMPPSVMKTGMGMGMDKKRRSKAILNKTRILA
jgi:hypothetical protein